MESINKDDVKRMLLPDLRAALRVRGLTPAGGLDALRQRMTEYLEAVERGVIPSAAPEGGVPAPYLFQRPEAATGVTNNYARSEGQNLGNFMTDRNSSRVLAPPGGASSISFGSSDAPAPAKHHFSAPEAPLYSQIPLQNSAHAAAVATAARNNRSQVGFGADERAGSGSNNNYARSESQNVGNFMTNRNSSHVTQPPGGASSIVFGA